MNSSLLSRIGDGGVRAFAFVLDWQGGEDSARGEIPTRSDQFSCAVTNTKERIVL